MVYMASSSEIQESSKKMDDPLANWDPRHDDFVNRQNATAAADGPAANFARSANLARNKEVVTEPVGLYVRNVPESMKVDGLQRLFSEYGKVLSAFIGRPRQELTKPGINWAIVKVGNMKDGMAMIAGLNHAPPLNLKVELALTEEERKKRKENREKDKQYHEEIQQTIWGRRNTQPTQPKENCPSEGGRGKQLSSLSTKVVNSGCYSLGTERSTGVDNDSLEKSSVPAVFGDKPTEEVSTRQGHRKVMVAVGYGPVAADYMPARPCVGCGDIGQLRCSICKAWYCGKRCQVDDWYYHRDKCFPPPALEADSCLQESIETGSILNSRTPKFTRSQSKTVNILESSPDSLNSVASPHHFSSRPCDRPIRLKHNEVSPSAVYDGKSVAVKNHKEIKRHAVVRAATGDKTQEECKLGSNIIVFGDLENNVSRVNNHVKGDGSQILRSSDKSLRNVRGLHSAELRRPFHAAEDLIGNSEPGVTSKVSTEGMDCLLDKNVFHDKSSHNDRLLETSNKSSVNENSLDTVHMQKPTLESKNNLGASPLESPSEASNTGEVIKQQSLLKSNGSPKFLQSMPSTFEEIKLDKTYAGIITVVEKCEHFRAMMLINSAEIIVSETPRVLKDAPFGDCIQPEIGSYVAALSIADCSWYRAFIFDKHDDDYNVCYIDFGNTEIVKFVKPLPKGPCTQVPPLAVVASLHGKVTPEVRNTLQNTITEDKPLNFKVIGKKNKSVKVSILSGQEESSVLAFYILKPWDAALAKSEHNDSIVSSSQARIPSLDLSHGTVISPANSVKGIEIVPPPHEIVHGKASADASDSDKGRDQTSVALPLKPVPHSKEQANTTTRSPHGNSTRQARNDPHETQQSDTMKPNDACNPFVSSVPTTDTIVSEREGGGGGGETDKSLPSPDKRNSTQASDFLPDPENRSKGCTLSTDKKTVHNPRPNERLAENKMSCKRKKFWAKDLKKFEVERAVAYDILPVWVNEDCQLYVHVMSETTKCILRRISVINKHCEEAIQPSDVEIGELVCGFVVGDGSWYRAEVLKVNGDRVKLYFVDFGNSEVLLMKNIRVFADDLMQIPSACVCAKLADLPAKSAHVELRLMELVKAELPLRMCSKGDGALEFEVKDNQNVNVITQIANSLVPVDLELSDSSTSGNVKSTSREQLQCAPQSPVSKQPIILNSSPSGMENAADIQLPSDVKSHSVSAVQLNLSTHPPTLPEPDSQLQHNINISSPAQTSTPAQINSPDEHHTLVKPTTLVEPITREDTSSPVHPTIQGQSTVPLLPTPSVQPSTPLLPTALLQSTCNASDDRNSSKPKTDVSGSVADQETSFPNSAVQNHSRPAGSRLPQMYEDCKTTKLSIAENVQVVFLQVNNPHAIFVAAMESLDLYSSLEEMMPSINKHCSSRDHGSLYRPKRGEVCLAKFSVDGLWYRAACLEPKLDSSVMFFVDFANTEEVDHSALRQIVSSFLEVPCIALHCILHGVSMDGVQEGASARLAELLPVNTPTNVAVRSHNDDNTYTIAIPSVVEALIAEGLVKPT